MTQETTIRSITGQELELLFWPSEGQAKGIVQLVHGMAEHIHRYEDTAKALNAAGYHVVGHTHLGHGKLAEIKGYFAEKDGWEAVLADTHMVRLWTKEQFPGVKHFLLGHSMGSFVARCYALRHGDLDGLIISGTGHFDVPILTAGSIIAGLQGLFGGAAKPCKLLHTMNFAANNKSVENPKTECDWLSRDEAQVAAYAADPLCGFMFTAKGYADMFTGLKMLYPHKLSAMNMDVPVYMFSGDKDPVGANGAGVKKVHDELKAAGVKDLTLKLYEGGRHEMFNEINREEVWTDLVKWLDSKA